MNIVGGTMTIRKLAEFLVSDYTQNTPGSEGYQIQVEREMRDLTASIDAYEDGYAVKVYVQYTAS